MKVSGPRYYVYNGLWGPDAKLGDVYMYMCTGSLTINVSIGAFTRLTIITTAIAMIVIIMNNCVIMCLNDNNDHNQNEEW